MGVEVNISGKTQLVGLLGSPVAQSMSPVMHTDSFKQLGIDAVYVAFDVEPEQLGGVVAGLKNMGAVGCNVTMPCKTAVGQYLDELTPAAEIMGAVNTVQFKDGKAIGHNTDGAGFVENLRHNGFEPEGKVATIVGAGGAGSAIFTQLALDGVACVNVFNLRDKFWDSTRERIADLASRTGVPMVLNDLENKEQLARAIKNSSLLINATRVGMAPDSEGCVAEPEMMHEGLFVADTVYEPRETKLIRMAKEQGLQTAPGIGMLLYQAALGEEIWFGAEMPVEYIEETYF
jgi:shikimate dehydrogenase